MSAGTSLALAVIRVPHGAPAPTREQLRTALDEDRARLSLPPGDVANDLVVTGPSAIVVGEQSLDEYVVWER